ncbi:hypothetical protein TRFO_19888 [Tritrichomonas foetus]|uniref:Uncharacterized protein n=1 Tax=Tritrichomonas foetus TaxID=1144522 RepID=A0A1J4KHB9_9EUKA|nr:hypothetical protein TRFO_19888 [Tritrichomonas foetus]|eukprot:OHT10753.1 hypothetical protein TRFO_19888 [Tritrichomonas foetus]
MDLDEWDREAFDEWEIESYDIPNDQPMVMPIITQNTNNMSQIHNNPTAGPFPEVEIGSSSDEEAPPIPESSQLARENLQLRARVEQLVQQSKSEENKNKSLKKQLFKCRNIFKHQIKSMKKSFK